MRDAPGPDATDRRHEPEALPAGRDTPRRQVRTPASGAGTPGRIRGAAVVAVTALACVSFTGAVVGVWAERSFLDNDVFARRAVPIAEDPAVQAAVSRWITDQVMTVVKPEELFAEALPERGRILAVPLAGAVRGFVQSQVDDFVRSDTFARLWAAAVTRAHAAAVEVVEGRSEAVGAEGGRIVVNLVPLVNAALARIGSRSPELFGRTIDFPDLTVEDLPASARQRLSQALGTPVGADFGVVRIDDGGRLAAAQDAVRLSSRLVWVLVALTAVSIPLALWLSRRRRRTLLQLVSGLALGLVLIRRVGLRVEGDAVDLIADDTVRAAARAIASAFLAPLLDTTALLLWVLALVAAVALTTGPYRWATALRRGAARVGATALRTAEAVGDRAGDERTRAWVRADTGALQAVGVVAAVVALVVLDLSWWGLLTLLVLLGAYQGGLWWLGRAATTAPAGGPAPRPGTEPATAPDTGAGTPT
jgi:hypothetical protein